MSGPLDPERLGVLRRYLEGRSDIPPQEGLFRALESLLADRDHWHALRGHLDHAHCRAEVERLRGERNDAQHEVCVSQAEAEIHATPEDAAAFLGWGHLSFGEAEASEGQPASTRRPCPVCQALTGHELKCTPELRRAAWDVRVQMAVAGLGASEGEQP